MKMIDIMILGMVMFCISGCGNMQVNSNENMLDSDAEILSESEIESEAISESEELAPVTEQEPTDNMDLNVSWDGIKLSPFDKVKVTYEDDKILSLYIEGVRYVEDATSPYTEVYGLTIDKENNSILHLKDFIPNQYDLTEQIEADCYDVAYGVYGVWAKEQIVTSIEKELKWDEWDEFYLNYYLDDTYVYIIVPTEGSDYSILKVKRSSQSGSAALVPTVPENELTLMQKVLFNQAEFYGNIDPYEEEYGWHKVEEVYGYGWSSAQFGVFDFDFDGKDEIYVYYGDALILHEEDGVIYGYCMPYRGLLNVCTDGTFIGSSGAADNDLMGNVRFNKHEMQYDTITSTAMDLSREEGIICYKNAGHWSENAVEITLEEYQEIMSHYQNERNVEYKLATETILNYVK